MTRPAFSLLLCLCVSAFGMPKLLASDSLLDRAAARSLPAHLLALFGHRSPDFKYDPRMIRAAEFASSRASSKPTWRCWHFVKDALLEAGVVSKRPESSWAKEAGDELCAKFNFRKLPITNPLEAPVGAVIVYGGADAGHVELRTKSGFVSDFISQTPYPRPLIGVYVKNS
jgi:hypothetical protein